MVSAFDNNNLDKRVKFGKKKVFKSRDELFLSFRIAFDISEKNCSMKFRDIIIVDFIIVVFSHMSIQDMT